MSKGSNESKVKSKKISATKFLRKFWTSARSILLKKLKFSKVFIQSIPNWIKSRPEAFKQWKIEDRKKKKYRSFKLQKRIKPEPCYIPSAQSLLADSFKFLWKNKRIFIGIFIVHLLIYFLLVRSPVTTSISTIQDTVELALGESDANSIRGTLATLGSVIGVSTTSQTNATAITVSVLFMSFVYIWSARQLHAGQPIRVRDAYYQSLTPAVPAILLLLVASLQLIPFALSSFIYATARSGGLFANGFEDLSIFIITVLIALLCLYWVTSTIIAFYIVTLPGMYPMQALRSAKKLIQFRRFTVFKRVIVLPLLLGLVYAGLLFTTIRFLPGQALFAAEVSQLLFLPVIHIYLYKLYRALI